MRHNRPLPAVEGLLTGAQVRATAASIAAEQAPDGGIPWPDGHVDAWDHVECAMAMLVGGLHDEVGRAWDWLARNQRADGTWPTETVNGHVRNADAETNQCAYIAVGLWHHYLLTGSRRLVDRMWPAVRAALTFVVDLQRPGGEIAWSRRADGTIQPEALLTGNASMYQSLRCGVALGELVGESTLDWELAAVRLRHAVVAHPELFADKSRFSMDWYYPVLGGALSGDRGHGRLAERWDEFFVPDLGVRCVSDRPWVTGAETCELALALTALGRTDDARMVLASMQHLRHADGSYWTGWVWPNQNHFPAERSTWTAAAVVLAADALGGSGPASLLFRGAGLAAEPPLDGGGCTLPACSMAG